MKQKSQITSRIIFNVPKKLKNAASRRARAENTTLTNILQRTLALYSSEVFDPEDFLTPKEIESLKRAKKDREFGRVYTLEEVRNDL